MATDYSLGQLFGAQVGSNFLNSAMNFGFNTLGSYFQNKYNEKMLNQQYQYNQALQDKAFQNNLQMWNMENEYNTPAAQLERMRAAGINPHLAYSHGSINNVAAASPSYSAPTYGFTPSASIGQVHSSPIDVAQTDVLRSQKSFNDAKAAESIARALNISHDNKLKGALAMFADDLARNKAEQTRLKTTAMQYDNENKREVVYQATLNSLLKENDYDFSSATLQSRIEQTYKNLELTQQHIVNEIKNGYLKDITYERIFQEVDKLKFLKEFGYSNGDLSNVTRLILGYLASKGFDVNAALSKSFDKLPKTMPGAHGNPISTGGLR